MLANNLLAGLREDYQRIAPQLKTVSLRFRQVLHKEGEKIREIYFPGGGIFSLTKTMQDGQTAQIAIIGNEGLVGPSIFFGDDRSPADAMVQVADTECQTMSVQAFNQEMADMRDLLYSRGSLFTSLNDAGDADRSL